MSLIGTIILLIIIGVVLQLVKEWVEPVIYKVALILIVIVAALLILAQFGIFTAGPHLR